MRIVGIALTLLLTSGVATANPISSFFNYEKPEPPVGGDCGAVASAIGPEATWYGEFIGNYVDDFNDQKFPYSARGCFKSETGCWAFLHAALNYVGRGELVHMSCRQGVRRY